MAKKERKRSVHILDIDGQGEDATLVFSSLQRAVQYAEKALRVRGVPHTVNERLALKQRAAAIYASCVDAPDSDYRIIINTRELL